LFIRFINTDHITNVTNDRLTERQTYQ